MKRWYRYADLDGYINADLQRVRLVCGFCRYKSDPDRFQPYPLMVYLCTEWQFKTTSLRALIDHYRNEHAENFVSVQALLTQTGIWRIQSALREPLGHILSVVLLGRRGFAQQAALA